MSSGGDRLRREPQGAAARLVGSRCPGKLRAENADDASELRRALRAYSIAPCIARRGNDASQGLGRQRFAPSPGCSAVAPSARYERRADLRQGLPQLDRAFVRFTFLRPTEDV